MSETKTPLTIESLLTAADASLKYCANFRGQTKERKEDVKDWRNTVLKIFEEENRTTAKPRKIVLFLDALDEISSVYILIKLNKTSFFLSCHSCSYRP